jgi:hypothetical protein
MSANPEIYISIVLGLIAVAGQLCNVILNLSIKAAILASEKAAREKVEADFVLEKTCQARIVCSPRRDYA